jgi:hypothetical protein
MEDKELKVFEFRWDSQGEKDWVCAYTNLHAIQTYLWITDANVMDFGPGDEVVEIPKEKWPEMKITHSAKEGDFQTFENYMATQTTADIICGTTY